MKSALVITKNSHLRENVSEMFELMGMNALSADSNCFGFKQTMFYHPDVIVCDMMVPETNGNLFRLLVKEESTTRHIPLILFCRGIASGDLLRKIQEDGDLYLSNPFTLEELQMAIDRCLK